MKLVAWMFFGLAAEAVLLSLWPSFFVVLLVCVVGGAGFLVPLPRPRNSRGPRLRRYLVISHREWGLRQKGLR